MKLGVLGGVQLYMDPFLWIDCRLADAMIGLTSLLSNGLKEEKERLRTRMTDVHPELTNTCLKMEKNDVMKPET